MCSWRTPGRLRPWSSLRRFSDPGLVTTLIKPRASISHRAADPILSARVPLIVALARAGYAAKGVVYIFIGVLAVLFVVGRPDQAADFSGAMIQALHLPFGRFLVAGLAIGFVGYSLWALFRASWTQNTKATTWLVS